jgi:hypothetical protein
MTVSISTYTKSVPATRKLARLQEGLQRVSVYVTNLSELDEEQLETLELKDQFDQVQRCLHRFEQTCLAHSQVVQDAWAEPEDPQGHIAREGGQPDQQNVRFEVQRANNLLRELSSSLTCLRLDAGIDPDGAQLSEDVVQLHQSVAAALQRSTLDWCEPA